MSHGRVWQLYHQGDGWVARSAVQPSPYLAMKKDLHAIVRAAAVALAVSACGGDAQREPAAKLPIEDASPPSAPVAAPAAPSTSPTRTPRPKETIGVPECDEYEAAVEQYLACYHVSPHEQNAIRDMLDSDWVSLARTAEYPEREEAHYVIVHACTLGTQFVRDSHPCPGP